MLPSNFTQPSRPWKGWRRYTTSKAQAKGLGGRDALGQAKFVESLFVMAA